MRVCGGFGGRHHATMRFESVRWRSGYFSIPGWCGHCQWETCAVLRILNQFSSTGCLIWRSLSGVFTKGRKRSKVPCHSFIPISLLLFLRLPLQTNTDPKQHSGRLSACLVDMPTVPSGGLMWLLLNTRVRNWSVCSWHECVKRISVSVRSLPL